MVIRVASVPSSHVYVRHLSVEGDGIHRLSDPPHEPPTSTSQWWPPRMLDPHWVRANRHTFDLMHIHFGFDAASPATLTDLVAELRAAGKPLVLTVHDLRNPHHTDPELHRAQMGVLVAAADAIITLTPGAAREISRIWGREAVVLPHPHVVDDARLDLARPARHGFRIGVHLKSLRASMAPLQDIATIVALLPQLPGSDLAVDVHTDVMTPGSPRYAADTATDLERYARRGLIDLRVHDFFTDDELFDYLQSLDLSVLPYLFGTHSGWLEACHDLGTLVAAPDVGHYSEQRPCLAFTGSPEGQRRRSLARAVTTAYRSRPQWRADPDARRRERTDLARAHRTIYLRALEERVACTS